MRPSTKKAHAPESCLVGMKDGWDEYRSGAKVATSSIERHSAAGTLFARTSAKETSATRSLILILLRLQVNIPKTRRTYCKGKECKKHTQHKVTQYKAGKVRHLPTSKPSHGIPKTNTYF
jgi:hypothetical protein